MSSARLPVSPLLVHFSPGSAECSEVIEHQIDILNRKRWGRGTTPSYSASWLWKMLPTEATVATYMVEGRGGGPTDHATIKQWALSDPEGFQPLIDLLTEAITQFLERQIEAGAEAVQLFESWAGILPEPFFEFWCVRPLAAVVKALRAKYPATPIIAFPRGAGLQYDGYVEATAVDGVGLDSTVPLAWAADMIQARLGRCVQGKPGQSDLGSGRFGNARRGPTRPGRPERWTLHFQSRPRDPEDHAS
jgi:hypothetical protein